MWTQGHTRSHNLKKRVVAKYVGTKFEHRIKTEYFKIIRTGEIVHNNHYKTNVGDLLVEDKDSLLSLLKNPIVFATKKQLLTVEDYLNEDEPVENTPNQQEHEILK